MSEFETFGFNIQGKDEGAITLLDSIIEKLEKIQKLQNGGIGVKTQSKSTTTRRRSSAEVKDMKLLHSNMEQVNASITKLNENLLLTLQTISKIASTSKSLPSNIPTLKDSVAFANYGKVNPKDIENANIVASTKSYKNYFNVLSAQKEMNGAQYKATRSLQLLNAEEKKRIDQQLKLDLGIKNTNKGLLTYGIRLTSVIAAARKLAQFSASAIKESASYIENLNLFAVTFGDTYKENAQWALDLANNLGLASSEAIRFTGLFKQLSTAIGNTAETGDQMSKVLTQFGYDLASFYNIDVTSAMEKLQAGIYSGQTKPLRSIGIDVTYQSIDNLLETNAALAQFNTSSKQLDQSQKSIARLIIALQSGSNAFGDMQRTIDSLANQMRVFEAGLSNFKLAIGDLVNEPLANALVYINGFIQGITQVIRAFKPLDTGDKDNMISNLGADAEETNNALDETQKRLAGFDKFNVLRTTSSTSDIDITEALTAELQKQIGLYNAQTGEISKAAKEMAEFAKQVRDFFVVVDEEGNFVEWTSSAQLLIGVLGVLATTITISLVQNAIPKLIAMFTSVKNISSLVAGAGIFLIISATIDLIKNWDKLDASGKAIRFIIIGVGVAFTTYATLTKIATAQTTLFATALKLSKAAAIGLAIGGIAILAASVTNLISNWGEMTTFEKVIGVLGAVGAAALAAAAAVAAFQGSWSLGTAIPAIVGGLLAITAAFATFKKDTNELGNFSGFADGGFSNANLIMTHENGIREWVGRQGTSTAVVNDTQMSDIMTMAVAKGTYQANMASGEYQGGSQVIHNHIYLDGKQIYEGVTDTAQKYGKKWANA